MKKGYAKLLRPVVFCLCLAVGAVPVAAQQKTQLQQSVELRLRYYDIDVDGRTLTTRQLAALHLLMPHNAYFGTRRYFRTRQEIRTILSWDPQ